MDWLTAYNGLLVRVGLYLLFSGRQSATISIETPQSVIYRRQKSEELHTVF